MKSEFTIKTNVSKMLEEQAQVNATILAEDIPRAEVDIPVLKVEDVEVTQTTIREYDNTIQLCRFIDCKLYKVEFGLNVKVYDILDYFDMDDYMFKRVSVR